MSIQSSSTGRPKSWWNKHLFNVLVTLLVVGGGGYLIASGNWHRLVLALRQVLREHPESNEIQPSIRNPIEIKLVDGKADTIRFITKDPSVPPTIVAKPSVAGEPLQLMGTLFLEPDAFVRVHSRFVGEVVRIGMVDEQGNEVAQPDSSSDNGANSGGDDHGGNDHGGNDHAGEHLAKDVETIGKDVGTIATGIATRAKDIVVQSAAEKKAGVHGLRMGDRVSKGQLLAVVWSKEIGEKKSELVDAISRLNLSRHILNRLLKLKAGVVPGQVINQAQRDSETDMIAMQRAERTLRSWRLTEEEIEAMHNEAERLHQRQKEVSQTLEDLPSEIRDVKLKIDPKLERKWAQIEVRSPLDGIVLERSFTVGEIVDTSGDMFKIGDPWRLRVLAFIYEEDLPYVRSLPPERRVWRIDLKSDPNDKPITASFDVIGEVIDPKMHTGAIMGPLNDPAGHFTSGQFVTCTIDRAADPTVVVVPSSAVIENGETSAVFVQVADGSGEFTRRRIHPVRRGRKLTQISSHADGLAAGVEALKSGEVVVSSGVLELSVELDNLKSSSPSHVAEVVAKTGKESTPGARRSRAAAGSDLESSRNSQ